MKKIPVPYIIFCAVNFIWLFAFAWYSFFSGVGASRLVAFSFIGLYVFAAGFCAAFALLADEKSALRQWIFVASTILMGLVLRIIARQIFQTAQMQDFDRAHEVYMYMASFSSNPFSPGDWADLHWFQLYYSRFPGWFPYFAVTRAVYSILGANARNMVALNYLMYMLSAALLYATVKRLFSFAVAFCAVAFFIFNPSLVVWTNITSPDWIFMLLFLCMLYAVSRYYAEGKRYTFLCAAAVFAALTDFFKPIGIMFLVAFFCVEIFMLFISRENLLARLKQAAVFLVVFLSVYGLGHALVSAGIRRVFHVETVNSTGFYMTFAWATDDAGNHTQNQAPIFEKFDRLMYEHNNNQVIVMEEMSRYAREKFADALPILPSILHQKARITFGDEGVLGWVIHSDDPERSAAVHRALGHTLWIGFTVAIFVQMILAAIGTALAAKIRHSEKMPIFVFLLTTVIGYTLVLLLGIVQSRYRLLLYPQFSILAAIGLVGTIQFLGGEKLYLFIKHHVRKIIPPADGNN